MKDVNKHHRIPSSRGGNSDKDNLKIRDVKEHDNRHRVYGNDTPAEQILKVLSVNSNCLNVDFKRSLIEVLKFFKGNYYKEKCLNYDPKENLDI
jgi:hypothetical protein